MLGCREHRRGGRAEDALDQLVSQLCDVRVVDLVGDVGRRLRFRGLRISPWTGQVASLLVAKWAEPVFRFLQLGSARVPGLGGWETGA